MGPIGQKILLLLGAGLALGFSYTPHQQGKVLKQLSREWGKINYQELRKNIRNLYKSHLIETKENSDGSYTYVLTNKGKLKALTFNFANMKIQAGDWDNKWRAVFFDIPEKFRKGRDALRQKLKELGFYELQKSVFVFPYECKDEVDFLIEFFNIRPFVRFAVLNPIDNDLHLKEIFRLA